MGAQRSLTPNTNFGSSPTSNSRGRVSWRQGNKFRARSGPVNPTSKASSDARSLGSTGQHSGQHWRLKRGQGAPSARPRTAQPGPEARTRSPDPKARQPAGARWLAVARDSCPLPLRLPSILRPLAAAVGTAGSPSVLPRARPAPAAEVWQRGAGEGAAADGDCRKAGC